MAAIRGPHSVGLGAALRRDRWPRRPSGSARQGGARPAAGTRRSQGAAGLRRSEQPSVLQRKGRRVREQDHRSCMAAKLDKKLAYVWYPQATGFVRNTLGAHRCDVIPGFPQGDELVQSTNPYYRTAYALVIKPGTGLDDLDRLGDPRLEEKRIGIVAGTPPATYLAVNGLMRNAKPYPLVVDTRVDSSAQAMMRDLASGEIDVGVLWGPMAGYYARQANPPLRVVPLLKESGGPQLAFRIAMGVRADRSELEAPAQPADRRQPARSQPGAARLRGAAARREGSAHHRGCAGAMNAAARPCGPRVWPRRLRRRRPSRPGPAAGAHGISHRELSRADAGDARRRPRDLHRRGRTAVARPDRDFHRRAAACAAARQPAGGHDLARQAAISTFPAASGFPTPATANSRRVTARLSAQQPRPRDRWRPREARRDLLPARLLDVVECGEAHPVHGLCQCRLVSRRHRRLDRRCCSRSRKRSRSPGRRLNLLAPGGLTAPRSVESCG